MTNSPSPALQKCAAQHFGAWMVHPQWFAQAVSAVKSGTFKADEGESRGDAAAANDPNVVGEWKDDCFKVSYYREHGIARIPFFGQVVKGESSFGGASSVWTRRSIRKAIADDEVSAILLHVDSPGGTVAGTGDLADDIYRAREEKPVYCYIEDLGASAAYWIASQCERIYANPTAEVGSIGTMTYVEDTSGMYEKAGIKVTLIATGKFKGQWIDGNPVSEEYIAAVRTEIEDLNEHFLNGVVRGRGFSREHLESVADGRVFIAEKAKQHSLIDEIAPLGVVMTAIYNEVVMTREQFDAYAAEHPDAAASFIEQGKKAGKAESATEERSRVIAILGAHGLADHSAVASITAGDDIDTAKRIADAANKAKSEAEAKAKADAEASAKVATEQAKQIERLTFEASGQTKPIGVAAGGVGPVTTSAEIDSIADPKERAKAEWKANTNACHNSFSSESAYIGYRVADLRGQIKAKAVRA